MRERFATEKELIIEEWKTNYDAMRTQLKMEKEDLAQEWKVHLERAREQSKVERENASSEWRAEQERMKDQIKAKDVAANDHALKNEFLRVRYIFIFIFISNFIAIKAQLQEKDRTVADLEERIARIKEEVVECETTNATLQRGIEKLKHESLKKDSAINDLLRKGNDMKDQLVDTQAHARELQVRNLFICFNPIIILELRKLRNSKSANVKRLHKF
jgi:hypothetical protein